MDFMKKIMPVLCALALTMPAMAQGNFSLSGKINGLPDSVKVILVDIEDPDNGPKEIASANPKNDAFELKGEVASPRMCEVLFQRYSPKQERYYTSLSVRTMIDPSNLTMAAPVDFDSLMNVRSANIEKVLKVTGSQIADEFAEFREAVSEAESQKNNAS